MVNWYLTDYLRLIGTYGIGRLDRFNLKGNYRRNLIDKPLEPNQEIWANGMKIICSRGGRISKGLHGRRRTWIRPPHEDPTDSSNRNNNRGVNPTSRPSLPSDSVRT